MFKTIRIHIKLGHDHVEITNLETGEVVSQPAKKGFSSIRNIVGNFSNAQTSIVAVLKELRLTNSFFSSKLHVLIQQIEGTEGGLSDIEKRALRDLGEMVGGRKVFIIEDSRSVGIDEALMYFN
jgi:hypothetical protein